MIDYETFKEMKTSAKVSPIDAEMINWDEDFKPIFDSQDANATSIRGTATVPSKAVPVPLWVSSL